MENSGIPPRLLSKKQVIVHKLVDSNAPSARACFPALTPLLLSRNVEICLSGVLMKQSAHLILMVQCIKMSFIKMTNKMQLYDTIYIPLIVLHVSSDIFAHHQELLNYL
jgi:hypothetical protein